MPCVYIHRSQHRRCWYNFLPNHLPGFSKLISSKRLQILSTMTNQYAPKRSAEAIASNNDLLAEILVRLPVKSLLRFKSVSKGWYSLISDHNFSRHLLPDSVAGLFLRKTKQYEFVPLLEKSFHAPFKSLTFVDNPRRLKIVQSCNGLLCCSSIYAYSSKQDYYINNPTTKQIFKLPQLPIEDTITVDGIGLAFDPTKPHDYKVVFIQETDTQADFSDDAEDSSDYTSYQIEIYSSKTRTWRVSGNPFHAAVGTGFKAGVCCNGDIHWINHWHKSLYFNVDEEKLGEKPTMPAIPQGWEERRVPYFGESQNHLHLIVIYGPQTTQFSIYEMEREYSSWLVKYHVNLDAIAAAFPEMISSHLDPSDLHYYIFCVFSVVREANDEESEMVLHIPGRVIRYNLKDGSFQTICHLASYEDNIDGIPIQALTYEWFDARQFIPTLSSG